MSKKTVTTFLVGFIIGSVSLSYAAWSAPTAPPPNGNVAAPINVSASSQDKLGVLTVGGLGVFGPTLITSAGGYTLPSTLNLGVNGKIGAKQYCDEKGNNCVSTIGGGGNSTNVISSSSGGWQSISIDDKSNFDVNCEYRAFMPKSNTYNPADRMMYFIAVSASKLGSAPSNDSEIYIPNTDKKSFYITPYGRADAWGMGVSKIEKRC